ncbi:PEX11 domain-containing protein [Trichophyton interdigitale]|uniref:PEX11 domain-containing protein n=1 Tax=Trichophyton interdigitale TaxID=101480 RepID=A0A9P4YI14_9EURO|nr:PEX11 domain-containing protein [Trichophyton interdigitale]KAF3896405.1 PEX11 domain-containing protein [Trichophyton interdigitale]KAG8210423.1 PEX11 domain-containing protein [Trichophyton interdigitale]
MATTPQPWMAQFSRYINSAPGIENTLRLLQFSCVILGSFSGASPSPWSRAGGQFALSRRYFRFFKFIDYFENAWAAYTLNESGPAHRRGSIASTLEFSKWSLLGVYLLLEGVTIFDALGAQRTSWGDRALLESNKFWLYALVFSLLSTLWQLAQLRQAPKTPAATQKKKKKEKGPDAKSNTDGQEKAPPVEKQTINNAEFIIIYQALVKDLIITVCDICIPGYNLGWIPISASKMGSAAVLSTLLVGRDRWVQVRDVAGS